MQDADLSQLTSYKEKLGCFSCGVHPYCGGRCPVQGLTAGSQRLSEYCRLMRLHVAVVADYAPAIKSLLEEKHYSLQRVYDECVFVNQFTDVTP